MLNSDHLVLKNSDYKKISSLVNQIQSETADLLEEELSRAKIVSDEKLPHDVVSMNSKVKFLDLESDKELEVTLVYPHEANMTTNQISILAPIGAALIGLRVGQVIQWPVPGGKEKHVKVIAVRSVLTEP